MLLHGIFPPITTPFGPDGQVYFKKLEHNVGRYSQAPLAGLVALGSTGEAILLSDQERRDVLRCVREAAAPDKVLIAGTGAESAVETLRLTEYAAELGYEVAMVRTPHYYKSQMQRPENMLAFYRYVADRSPLPVIIYNFPQATAYDIPIEVVIALAEHPNLIGIKESCGSIEKVRLLVQGTRHIGRTAKVTETFQALTPRMLERGGEAKAEAMVPAEALSVSVSVSAGSSCASLGQSPAAGGEQAIKTREKEVGFQVLVGSADKFYDLLQAGAVGGILAFADAAPTAMYEVYAAYHDGDRELAREKQQRVTTAAAKVVGAMGIPGVKYACDLNGYYGGPLRLPLLPLTMEDKREVEKLMRDIKN